MTPSEALKRMQEIDAEKERLRREEDKLFRLPPPNPPVPLTPEMMKALFRAWVWNSLTGWMDLMHFEVKNYSGLYVDKEQAAKANQKLRHGDE